ncbi:hypothetical protein QTP86_024206 [Hemibagrus guttatus]|nr:hypothetical protein QTP86_024206 [Hemibagrus guttatus]
MLHWLLKEPLIHAGHLDISGVTAPALSRALISLRVVTLRELVNITEMDLSWAEYLAARLGLRSLRVVNQILHCWRTSLTSERRVQLMDYQTTKTNPTEGPFPQLDIAPDLDGPEGLLLECWGVRELDFGSVSEKLLYRACVKVLNKKKLSGKVDTPWRSVLGFNADIKPEWRALYKPPLTKKAADLQWRILHEVKMGRGSPIPPMLRPKIVEQYQKGVSQRKIAKSLKLSSSTVHDIIQSFRESGTISVRKGQGRQTILDARDLRALRRHCIIYRNATVMEITTWAQEYFQKTLSVNTIHRAIRRCRLKLYRSKKKPYLNMIQKRRRFLWAKAHLKWTVAKWKTVLWSDESKFEVLFGKLGRHVIRNKEDKDNPSCYQRSVQKPASLMVWGCMSVCGMGSLHIWKGTINAERLRNLIELEGNGPEEQPHSANGISSTNSAIDSMHRDNAGEENEFIISEHDVRKAFRRVNTRKAAGPDGIKGQVLKACADQLVPVFTEIFTPLHASNSPPLFLSPRNPSPLASTTTAQ